MADLYPPSPQGNGNYYWSLLLANWALRSGYSCISLSEWKFLLLNPWVAFISSNMAMLFMSPLSNDRGSCWKRFTDIHATDHLVTWLLTYYSDIAFWGAFVKDSNLSSYSVPSQRNLPTYIFLKHLVTSFPIVLLTNPQPSSQTISHCQWISENLYIWTFILPDYSNKSLLKVMHTETFFHYYPSEL